MGAFLSVTTTFYEDSDKDDYRVYMFNDKNGPWDEKFTDFFTNTDPTHCPLYDCGALYYNSGTSTCTGGADASDLFVFDINDDFTNFEVYFKTKFILTAT